jgi:hypothetical protein
MAAIFALGEGAGVVPNARERLLGRNCSGEISRIESVEELEGLSGKGSEVFWLEDIMVVKEGTARLGGR